MNKKQQELFVAFFEEVFEAEQAFEELKKKMNKCHHFNPHLLFSHISMGGQDQAENDPYRIKITRLRSYLTDKTTCNQRELYELFEKLDFKRLGFISIQDFVRQLTPIHDSVQPDNGDGAVTPEIQGFFLALVAQYIQRFRILQVLRKQLHFIWPYNAFIQIDNFLTGIVGLGELERFMNKNDYKITPVQLMFLLHGLRRRHYLQVNLEVFCQNLDPLEFGEYENYKKQIEQQKEKEFLSRSRREQQTMRRSRIQSWKIQHNIAKEDRRKRAEKERQLQLEQRITNQIKDHEKQKQRYVRRAMLEQDKNIRWNVATGSQALEVEKDRHLLDRLKNESLHTIRDQQNQIKHALVRSAYAKEDQLENSRRARHNLEVEREIQEQLQYKKELQRREFQLHRQRIIEQDLERQRQIQRRQIMQKQKNYAFELQRQRESQRLRYISEAEANRKLYEQELRIQRERAQRQYELERIRNQEYAYIRNVEPTTTANSRRVQELERQLERTRSQIRDRQSRLNLGSSKKQPETAEREYSYR